MICSLFKHSLASTAYVVHICHHIPKQSCYLKTKKSDCTIKYSDYLINTFNINYPMLLTKIDNGIIFILNCIIFFSLIIFK